MKGKHYSVNLWGSHPEAGNDDCWSGKDFPTREEAVALYESDAALAEAFNSAYCVISDALFIEIDGPGIYEVRGNPNYVEPTDTGDDWKRERAMQAGMAFGCSGYNDEMGC